MKYYHHHTLLLILLLLAFQLSAQDKILSGYIRDKASDEPIPFANISIKGTNTGTVSTWDGYYSIRAQIGDTIQISSIGFEPQQVLISSQNKQIKNITLHQAYLTLNEVNVLPDKDFAKEILKQIQIHKKANHKEVLSTKEYKNFAKSTIYMALDSNSRTSQFFQEIDATTNNIEDENLKYTPIYIAQEAKSFSDHIPTLLYNNKQAILPKLNETIESIMAEYLLVKLDFYEDQIYIFDKGFVSPLNKTAPLYYNISFTDSLSIDNETIYNFIFYPKNEYAPLFTGEFSINKADYALRQINVYFKAESNINFVTGFKTTVAYERQENGKMFFSYQDIKTNLSFTTNKEKETSYSSERVNEISKGDWLLNKTTIYSTSDELNKITAEQWEQQAEFKTKAFEPEDYARIEAIQKESFIRNLNAFSGILLTGYLNMGYYDIGSFFDMYRTNAIEGNRLTLPIRTSEKLFKYVTVGGFIGYGDKNNEFKYGGNIAWQPFKKDKYILRFAYSDDYLLASKDKFQTYISNNTNAQGSGNIVTALTTKERNPYIKQEKTSKLTFEYNADKDLAIRVAPYHTYNKGTQAIPFIKDGKNHAYYQNTGTLINVRYAPGQRYDKLYFDRIYYFTKTPILNLGTDIGHITIPGYSHDKSLNYAHMRASIQGDMLFGNLSLHYLFNGGYLIGNTPYDLLDMPAGSLSLGYNKYRYTLLHQAAFAHNLYSNAYLDLNGGGVLLSRIPLFKRLQWRERATFKCHYGTRNAAYNAIFEMPEAYQHTMTYPYMEFGLGVTNIFKFLHIEYFRQIGNYYQDNSLADRNGIRINAELRF